MINCKLLYNIHRNQHNGELYRHARLSSNVLSRLSRELDKHPLPYRVDFTYPFHLIVNCNCVISVHNNGYNNRMDIQRLTDLGNPDRRYPEKSFLTPKGVVNYIIRKWGK
jgi:hypothetical protein